MLSDDLGHRSLGAMDGVLIPFLRAQHISHSQMAPPLGSDPIYPMEFFAQSLNGKRRGIATASFVEILLLQRLRRRVVVLRLRPVERRLVGRRLVFRRRPRLNDMPA